MALLASDIITWARSTLLDASARSWSDAELVSYLNGGVTQIIALKPDANPQLLTFGLSPGVEQQLDDACAVLIDTVRNSLGQSVTVQPTHEFVRVNPAWASASSGQPRYVLYDPRIPRVFHVSPPAQSGLSISLMVGKYPTRVVATSDAVGLPYLFESALWAFVVASAYAKNSKRQDFAKSDQFMKLFMQFMAPVTPTQHQLAAQPDVQGVR